MDDEEVSIDDLDALEGHVGGAVETDFSSDSDSDEEGEEEDEKIILDDDDEDEEDETVSAESSLEATKGTSEDIAHAPYIAERDPSPSPRHSPFAALTKKQVNPVDDLDDIDFSPRSSVFDTEALSDFSSDEDEDDVQHEFQKVILKSIFCNSVKILPKKYFWIQKLHIVLCHIWFCCFLGYRHFHLKRSLANIDPSNQKTLKPLSPIKFKLSGMKKRTI